MENGFMKHKCEEKHERGIITKINKKRGKELSNCKKS